MSDKKFTPLEDVKADSKIFEQGNTYSAAKQGVTEEQLTRWHAAGWVEVEGWDPAPPRVVRGAVLQPHNGKLGAGDSNG